MQDRANIAVGLDPRAVCDRSSVQQEMAPASDVLPLFCRCEQFEEPCSSSSNNRLNGLQFGLLLFLLAAGLTLVFGIMDLVNLAHGSLYMMGAYFAATFAALDRQLRARRRCWRSARRCCSAWCSRWWRCAGSTAATISIRCSATFGLILFFNDAGAADLGPGRPDAAAAGLADGAGADHARRLLSGLSAVDHRGRARGRGRCSMSW